MNTRLFNDVTRAYALAGIEKVAPQSALLQVPAIAASLAALTAKGATLATDVSAVSANEKVFKASVSARNAARLAFDLEIDTLRTLVENNANAPGDVTGMGFALLTLNKASRTPPDPPAALIVKIGKAHGKARVSVAGNGYLGCFAAQVSPDPQTATSWSDLPGKGKERRLSGYASGTKLWVRFATVRFGMQSDYCTPVLVTIP
jgi:hypothetical protein